MKSVKKWFEMLNRINHTPSVSDKFKLDAKIHHVEQTNAILTSPNGERTDFGKGQTSRHTN